MTNAVEQTAIRRMVDDFYGRVRSDALLGPIFAARVDGRWPAHLDKMVEFWSAALLPGHRYTGNPRAVHATLEEAGPAHFERWLALFAQTLHEVFPPEQAAIIHIKAQAMARGLSSARQASRRSHPPTHAPGDA